MIPFNARIIGNICFWIVLIVVMILLSHFVEDYYNYDIAFTCGYAAHSTYSLYVKN